MTLNQALDRLPRTRFGRATREVPAFRTCGIAGFYAAVVVAFAGGLLAGVQPLAVATVCLSRGCRSSRTRCCAGSSPGRRSWSCSSTCGSPRPAWRRSCGPRAARCCPRSTCSRSASASSSPPAGSGACSSAAATAGRPSVGIRYGREAVRDGFPPELEGLRLSPGAGAGGRGPAADRRGGARGAPRRGARDGARVVPRRLLRPALRPRGPARRRAAGAARPVGQPLDVRDRVRRRARPRGARGRRPRRPRRSWCWRRSPARSPSASRPAGSPTRGGGCSPPRTSDELRATVDGLLAHAHTSDLGDVVTTSGGVAVAASLVPGGAGAAHVSLSRPGADADVELMCELAARVLPGIEPGSARTTGGGIVHVVAHPGGATGVVRGARAAGGRRACARRRRRAGRAGGPVPPRVLRGAPRCLIARVYAARAVRPRNVDGPDREPVVEDDHVGAAADAQHPDVAAAEHPGRHRRRRRDRVRERRAERVQVADRLDHRHRAAGEGAVGAARDAADDVQVSPPSRDEPSPRPAAAIASVTSASRPAAAFHTTRAVSSARWTSSRITCTTTSSRASAAPAMPGSR